MSKLTRRGTGRARSTSVLLGATVGLVVTAVPPAAASPPNVIVLPGASSAEGIAKGEGDTFYAGDLFLGDIFRGDLQDRTAELFIDAPDGRRAVGMFADLEHDLLFVAGGFTGAGVRVRHWTRRHRGQLPVRRPPPTSSTTSRSRRTAPGSPTASRPRSSSCRSTHGEPGRVRARWSARSGGRHQRRVQPERHRSHRGRRDAHRRPLGQRSAVHRGPGHWRQRGDRRRERAWVDGIVLEDSGCGRCRT